MMLQYVEFSGGDEDDLDDPPLNGLDLRLPNPNADKANSQHGKSLELLLAAKNKRILEELTKFRVHAYISITVHPLLTCSFYRFYMGN